ncbi:hypothetical protein [Glycomyces tarimensis]
MPLKFNAVVRRKWLAGAAIAVIAVVVVTTGVLASTLDEPRAVSDSRAETAVPRSQSGPRWELDAERLLREADLTGEFSFVLYDSVEDRYLLSHRADATHFSQSIVKLLIAVGALQHEADESSVAEMLSRSDDLIASELWAELNGPAVIDEQAGAMGLVHTAPSAKWVRWGDTLISASDVVRVYIHLLEALPGRDRAIIFDALAAMTETGADGFDQTFGIPSAADGRDWAVKQGWGCCKPDRFLVSTGTIGPDHRYIAAVFGAWDENQVDEAQAAEEMTTLSAAAIEFLSAPARALPGSD